MYSDDGFIIQECLEGESEAFGVLVDKYKAGIYAFVYSKLGDFHDAQDVTQEVFLQAYRNLRNLRRWESFSSWLYRIAYSWCRRWIQSKARHSDVEFIEDQVPETLEAASVRSYRENALNESLRVALDSLSDTYREVLILRYFGGMNSVEIAKALGTSPTAIRMRLSRARALLREEMIAMMDTAFEGQRLQISFTFRIVEAVKHIKIHPTPRTAGLPWGLSLTAGIVIALLSLGSHLELPDLMSAPMDLTLSEQTALTEVGEIPVDVLKISRIPTISGKQGNEYGVGPGLLDAQSAYLLAPRGKDERFPEAPAATLGKGRIHGLAYSPDGKLFAVATSIGIRLHDTADMTETGFLRHTDAALSVSFSPDGKLLASGSGDNKIRLWDIAEQEEAAALEGHSDPVYSVSFSPDGKLLATGSGDNTVRLWNIDERRQVAVLRGHTRLVDSVAFSPDGKLVASGTDWDDSTICLWDVEREEKVAVLKGHTGGVLSIAFSPDGKLLASGGGSQDHTVRLWDIESKEEIAVLKEHTERVRSVSFSPDGNLLASGSSDGTIRLWDVAEKSEVAVLRGHTWGVWPISFSPDGELIASGSLDGTVRFWDVKEKNEVAALEGFNTLVYSVAFSPDGKSLASGADWGNDIRLWDVKAREEVAVLEHIGAESYLISVSFSPDGKWLASGSNDRTIRLWDVVAKKEVAVLRGHTKIVLSVSFSPDSKLLASASGDKTVRLWDVMGKKETAVLTGHTDYVESVSFSPDGKLLASGSEDKTIRLWDVEAVKVVATLRGHTGWVKSVSFSPDGKLLASGSDDRTIRLWDVEAEKAVATLRGHTGSVQCVSFSPDGKFMASAGGWQDGSVRIWDVTGQKAVAVLREHAGPVRSVSFSPDGELLASGGYDGTILLWEVNLPGISVEPMGKLLGTWGEVKKTELHQNFPNPFNPETWIPYQLAEDSDVTINIFSVSGQLVRKLHLGQRPSGAYLSKEKAAYWDGRNEIGETVASDIYFYAMEAGGHKSVKKMVLAR